MEEDKVIKKWKDLLEWSSISIPPVPEEKYFEVASVLERVESEIFKNFEEPMDSKERRNRTSLAKRLISHIRKNEGVIDVVRLNDKDHYVIEHMESTWAVHPDTFEEKPHPSIAGMISLVGFIKSTDGDWRESKPPTPEELLDVIARECKVYQPTDVSLFKEYKHVPKKEVNVEEVLNEYHKQQTDGKVNYTEDLDELRHTITSTIEEVTDNINPCVEWTDEQIAELYSFRKEKYVKCDLRRGYMDVILTRSGDIPSEQQDKVVESFEELCEILKNDRYLIQAISQRIDNGKYQITYHVAPSNFDIKFHNIMKEMRKFVNTLSEKMDKTLVMYKDFVNDLNKIYQTLDELPDKNNK